MIRLDKYLADMGIGTRTEVKKLIRQGKVTVDGSMEKSPEQKIDISRQKCAAWAKQSPMKRTSIIC